MHKAREKSPSRAPLRREGDSPLFSSGIQGSNSSAGSQAPLRRTTAYVHGFRHPNPFSLAVVLERACRTHPIWLHQLIAAGPSLGSSIKKGSSTSSRNAETANDHCFTHIAKFLIGRIRIRCTGRQRGPERSALSSAVKLAVAGVGKRSKDGAGALIDRLTNVHGEGEKKDEKEEIDAKQRMQ